MTFIWVPSDDFYQEQKKWLEAEVKVVGMKVIRDLAMRASKQRRFSYSPYSKYKVGVTLLATSGRVYKGANMERAGYSETDHGEEAAVTAALLGGEVKKSGRKFIRALAVSHDGDTAPCGRCRQIIAEHADNCLIITANPKGEINRITSLQVLLPYAFTPSDLGID